MGAGLIGMLLLLKIFWRQIKNFFLTLSSFEKYELNCNFVTYMQVVSAVPQSLIDKARIKLLDKSTYFSVDKLSTDITINSLKMKIGIITGFW